MKLSGKIFLIIVLAVSIVLMGGCQSGKDSTQEKTTWETIKEKGEIVAGLDDAFPPFGYRNEENELVGFDIELGQKIAEKLGIKIKWQPTDWNGVILSLKSRKFDIIFSGMSITEERKKEINFSSTYMAGAQVLVVLTGNDEINSKDDLKDRTVGTQLGSTGEAAARSELKELEELRTYDAFTAAFNDLATGRLDAVVVDDITAMHYLKERTGEFKIVKDVVLSYEPMGVGIRKDDEDLLEAINKAFKELVEDGTYGELTEKWFGMDMTSRIKEINGWR